MIHISDLLSIRGRMLRYLGILVSCLIASASINLFIVPAHLLSGGASGISMILYYLTGFPIGLGMFILNIPLVIAAYRHLGRSYTLDITYGMVMYSICLDALHFLSSYAPLSEDIMLSAIVGGAFNGIGFGLLFRFGGSSGGLDIVAAIVKKYWSFNMGSVIFAFNCVIMAAAGSLFGVQMAFYTLLSMFTNSTVTDKVVAGFNRRKVLLVISEHVQQVAEGIILEVGRGVTFLHGQGAFTRRERDVLFVVCSLTQISKIKMIAENVDENAFMIVLSANEVMGRGFSLPSLHFKAMLKERNDPAGKNE
ncbi:YitT family protein [Selenomonas sp. TAMA-11512]|uniref:YitT family protein n=1 Tax=Selenomonas sp. TAMA-11512 TaxID=3095337 RepID=UPI003084AADC|nr:YitT family protein [Selenomonas sp. TAMA-11512]